jgi:uncharacterized membrane protein YsdA (DUF1294 family)
MTLKQILFAYAAMSVITFVVYARDKSAATRSQWRTSEKTLHVLSTLCGWPGALLAQRLLRHKASKMSFRIAFWTTVALNIIGLATMIWLSHLKSP